MSEKKKKVGVYIGKGLPPDNVQANMAIDMTELDTGIMISGSAANPEDVPPVPDILDALMERYPEHQDTFEGFKAIYQASGSKEERDGVLYNLGVWLKNHVDNVSVGIPGFFNITFK